MAFDTKTRNSLAQFVAAARDCLSTEFADQLQRRYGIAPDGQTTQVDQLRDLDDRERAVALRLRERIDYLVATHPDERDARQTAVARLAREQAFTVLNRLAALRMAEARGIIPESVGQSYLSKGFKVFASVAGSALGETYTRYRQYLHCLFDELAVDLGALFDRRSPHALLFPGERSLVDVLSLLNAPHLESLWAEDETIGWIYQYYNDPEERKKMRKASAAPRNSRELAVRNQFFTPRYVVEFLTDNTLGRIWYEMTQGHTALKEQCRYLVRRPNEIFLSEGESAAETPDQGGLNQEELLQQPVQIPYRPLKDPRSILMLDPACGSMHFGLYAFDLFEVIYEEAWNLAETHAGLRTLISDFSSKEEFLRQVPRLIIEHNIHGIDIDPRAAQIAGLSLWLRAQKSWQRLGLKAAERPTIKRSNIVCAEPMPGSAEMLEEFVATLDQPLLGELVKTVFDKMQLAGEAGSLLKIEEDIRTAIDTARKKWLKQQDDLLARKDGSQEEFFDTAEQQVIDALRAYAEQADADSYQRRLFADDAARGFAFIDLCRKRYDAVVMNPPFGEWSAQFKAHSKKSYPNSANDILAAFVDRGGQILNSMGRVGAITSRSCFFLSSFSEWRSKVVLDLLSPHLLADLGLGVMDTAMVEAAAYVLQLSEGALSDEQLTTIRLNDIEEPADPLSDAIRGLAAGAPNNRVLQIAPSAFRQVPNAPFAYWLGSGLLRAFGEMQPFESADRVAKRGVNSNDDFRFLRLSWEVTDSIWVDHVKGGEFSRFYSDPVMKVKWGYEELTAERVTDRTYKFAIVPSRSLYFRPGFTWSLRTQSGLSFRALPKGCIFGSKGPAAIIEGDSPKRLLAYMAIANSSAFSAMAEVQTAFGSYEVGVIQRTPVPDLSAGDCESLANLSEGAWLEKCKSDTSCLISHQFVSPLLGRASDSVSAECSRHTKKVRDLRDYILRQQRQINDLTYRIYKIGEAEREAIEKMLGSESLSDEQEAIEEDSVEGVSVASDFTEYALGTTFGRWDIRYATGERRPPELPDPFDPLPVCPPGMLQNNESLPAEPKDVPADYPLRISWPGILVDDENHPEDIVARVREAIEVIWKDRAETIEHEAGEILGVKSLRDYFRKPAGLFADHLKRYSKSRRQAPIYWPLSTRSGKYTLWIYYHRLTGQTLHTALADFVVPKLRTLAQEIARLREANGARASLEEALELEGELLDFQAELERILQLPWQPNLNDGVLITASPLWKLFRLPGWQKELKACWEELSRGDYDWAHLALTLWPDRVREKCRTDRSLAIAHGLEHLCQVEPPKPKQKRGKKKALEQDFQDDAPELIREE